MAIETNEEGKKLDKGFEIRSIQAASVYRVNKGYKFCRKDDTLSDSYLDFGKAVINDSIFARYARKHGVTVNKRGRSDDFVMMKFDWGVDSYKDENGNIKEAVSKQELRKDAYKNGVTITWKTYNKDTGMVEYEKTITYRMLMRNPGKAKEGHCIFVREDLLTIMRNYITMCLWEKMPEDKAKIVEMSAYAPLITATAVDYIKIPLDSIFIVKDEEVVTNKPAYIVKVKEEEHEITTKSKDFKAFEELLNPLGYTTYKKKKDDYIYIERKKECFENVGLNINDCPIKETIKTETKPECYVEKEENAEISNILWDGMGIIDESIFPKDKNGFIYCRNHFFKSCLFRGNIQAYFQEYYSDKYETKYIFDYTGRKFKVSDIKVIITENSIKWIKFLDLMGGTIESGINYYDRILKKDNYIFQIVKDAHASKYGEIERSSFQMNNTLLTTNTDTLKKIAQKTIDTYNNMKKTDKCFVEYLKQITNNDYSIANVLIALCERNSSFVQTDYYKKKKSAILSKLKNEQIKLGKLFQRGANLTIAGNVMAMLVKVVGENPIEENCFEKLDVGEDNVIQCYTEQFNDGEYLAAFRSPHNSPNNIMYFKNEHSDLIKKYFPKLGKNVIVVNGIGTDIQCRGNGLDFDTDGCYATNQTEMVELAKDAYKNHYTIRNDIIPIPNGKNYKKDMESYAKMDQDIAAAQYSIGLASNIAQLALSYWFDGECKDDNLRDVFIMCSVLAQCSIDSAKRTFEIDVNKELNRISKMDCMQVDKKYPKFYADVQKYKNEHKKGKKIEIKDENIKKYNCPMDILYDIFDEELIDLRNDKSAQTSPIRISKIINDGKINHNKVNRRGKTRFIQEVETYTTNVQKLDSQDNNYSENKMREFESLQCKVRNLKIGQESMKSLVNYAFKRENTKIRDNLLVLLCSKDKEKFIKCFKAKS